MKVVLDTNVLLISISKNSPFRPIFDAVINGEVKLVISNEIISEYVEILEARTNATVAVNIADFLLKSSNVEKIEIFYRWHLIEMDKDDNKFVDCAIAGNAQFIVTNDKHFEVLKNIQFPKVEVVSSTDFLQKLQKAQG